MMKTKMCTECHQQRPLDDFHRDGTSPSGLRYNCKFCVAKRWSEYKARRPRRKSDYLPPEGYKETQPAPPPAHVENPDQEKSPGQEITDLAVANEQVRQLHAEVNRLRHSVLTEERVRREILKLAEAPSNPPTWLVRTDSEKGCYGVPTLFLSDQHLGEVVDPDQIGGVNKYNMEIARARWRRCIEKTIDLCYNFLARPQFDGIVLAFGGDGVSGDIHEELSATNDEAVGTTTLELADLISWSVRELRKAFGRVFVPCVIGNHARMSMKPRYKCAAVTSFDWLAYQMASREFAQDPMVTFNIPSGLEAHWRIYNHRYTMTHGSQFSGGGGIAGVFAPVVRGDARIRARSTQVGAAYDTLLVAHFHQLKMDSRIIMNGSLIGYNEMANACAFPYEPPRQALWLTHPRYRITFSFPVMPEDPPPTGTEPWTSWHPTTTPPG